MADALLGLFFKPFIFENLPASEQSITWTYLDQAAKCDIYIGLFGKEYGYQDENGISPTEHEFNQEKFYKHLIAQAEKHLKSLQSK